jgi:hypothetical protein
MAVFGRFGFWSRGNRRTGALRVAGLVAQSGILSLAPFDWPSEAQTRASNAQPTSASEPAPAAASSAPRASSSSDTESWSHLHNQGGPPK